MGRLEPTPAPVTTCHNCPERRELLVMHGGVSYCEICDAGCNSQRKESK